MKKEILNLEGVTLLTKSYQKDIIGGLSYPTDGDDGGQCYDRCSSDAQCPQRGSMCQSYECIYGGTTKQCTRGY